MAVILSSVSHKGGAGKSTIAANLAGAFAEAGRRVLVVDVDPQGGVSAALGVEVPEAGTPDQRTTYELVLGSVSVDDAAVETPTPGVWLIGANLDLAAAEIELPAGDPNGWRDRLRVALDDAAGWDVVIVDTAPGLGVLPYLGLAASTVALVAMPPEFLAYRVVGSILGSAREAGVPVVGIVPTMVGRSTLHQREVLDALAASDTGVRVLPSIPARVAVKDAAVRGVPVTTSAPRSAVADAFRELAREVSR